MSDSIIEKLGMEVGRAKDVENAVANTDKYQAFMDYIAICDHPEILDDEEALEDE